MSNATTLNLEEDQTRISEIFEEYLEKNSISAWKYEAALKILTDQQLEILPTKDNMTTLGKLYLDQVIKKYQDRKENSSLKDSEKIESLKQCINVICTSTQIKKLLNVARYSSELLNDSIIQKCQKTQETQETQETQQDQQDNEASLLEKFESMNPAEKMMFLCNKFGTNGHLNLMTDHIDDRFRRSLKDTTSKLELSLQPMSTKDERDMLMKIANCKTKTDIDNLLEEFYSKKSMDPLCRYIRLAFARTAELWSSGLLLELSHNEDWFRNQVYSAVFDNVFTYDKKFTIKRAECYSKITKEFADVENQRVDFILRNINNDDDYLSAEEKPSLKGVKSDMKKGKLLQKAMLRKWTRHLRSIDIMKQLEAITCQWQGLKLVIFGTRYLSKDHIITYRKGTFLVPKEETHAGSFACVLAAVLSLRRLVLLNYTKLNMILEMKCSHELEMMYFANHDETEVQSNSSQEETNDGAPMNAELESEILQAISHIKSEEQVITCADWEDLVLESVARKRKNKPQKK